MLAATVSVLSLLAPQDVPPAGSWRAWLDCPGGELPFELKIDFDDGKPFATIVNGRESIHVPHVELGGDTLELSLEPYDSRIRANISAGGQRMDGTWRKRRGAERWSEMKFHAEFGAHPRFPPRPPDDRKAVAGSFAGRWRVQFATDQHPSVGLFEEHGDGSVTGTFLTTLGDYRYLAGDRAAGNMHLSCFDGGHAFLFTARMEKDGTLRGDFWSSLNHHEAWTAARDDDAELPDAFALTRWNDAVDLGELRYPDLEGNLHSLDDPAYRGKGRILQVFGTWCPNCNDASRLLAELDARYRARGLSILGLAFEHTGDHERDAEMVRQYRARHGCEYPVLLAGVSDKAKASAAFPALDRVRSYPTTIFLDGDGKVRAIHTGFSGPATGAAHEKLRAKFEALIVELLR